MPVNLDVHDKNDKPGGRRLLPTEHLPGIFKWAGILVSGLFSLIIVLLIAAWFYLKSDDFRDRASGYLSTKSSRKVTLGSGVSIHPGRVTQFSASNISIANPDWAGDPTMFSAERLNISIKPLDLLRFRLSLPLVEADKPRLWLERNAEGKANWDFSQNPAGAAANAVAAPDNRFEFPVIGELRIVDGTVVYRDAVKKINLESTLSTVSGEANAKQTMQLSAKGTLDKKPLTVTFNGGSVLQLRESNEPYPFDLKVTTGSTSLIAEGTADDPVALKGVDLKLRVKGASAAELFPLTGIALPPTKPYDIGGHLNYDESEKIWKFSDFSGRMGSSDLHGDLAWDTSQKKPFFKAQFVSNNLDMADLAPFIGASKEQKKPDGRVLPDLPINTAKLDSMNADVTFKGKHIKTTDVLDNFSMHVKLNDSVLTLEPVSFGIASGDISANVTIDGNAKPPSTAADVTFHRLSLTRLFAPLAKRFGEKNVSAGVLGGKAKLKGSGASLRDMLATSDGTVGVAVEGGKLSRLLLELAGIDLWKSLGVELSGDQPVDIRCVVGDFEANNGLLSTRALVADTDVTTLQGEGTINLKNEALNMRLTVHPKDTTLFSARAPINITGTLGKPSVLPDLTAVAARGGLAVVLGALLTPIGSLLAFVEPGLGENSPCASFLHKLKQDTGATSGSHQQPKKGK